MSSKEFKGKAGDPLDAALNEFYEAWFAGKRPDPESFCRRHPECGPGLRAEIEDFLFITDGLPASESSPKGERPEEADVEPRTERVIGDFRIRREIGRGGMGVVYEAEQISLRRRVALKVLPGHFSLSPESIAKFKREAEAGARQRHPGIVSVYSIGEHEGINYIVQELVAEGRNLSDWLDALRRKGDLPEDHFLKVAGLFAAVAEALHHAHVSGVIHRDVKPSNILLTREGDPKITDFGLAKMEDALALSRTGEFAGTPYYMSPEQTGGFRRRMDHRTDIFSLGVTLYEALTLARPFEAETTFGVLKKIVSSEPLAPARVNPRVPRALELIVLKTMEKNPEARYATMGELALDLRRYMAGEAVAARPPGPLSRTARWGRRHPRLSATGMVLALVLLPLCIWMFVHESADRRSFEKLMAEAVGAALEERWSDAVRYLDQAMVFRPGDPLAREKHREWARKLEKPAAGATVRELHVPREFPTIQDAILAAGHGDRVLVDPGSYEENLRFYGKAITLKSTEGPGVTVIDGRRAGSVVAFNMGEGRNSVLDGFTLKNGLAENGGGILCVNGSPTIINNEICKNEAGEKGGGICCLESSSPVITQNTIRENQACEDGEGGGIFLEKVPCEVSRNRIMDNTALYGGGVFCKESPARIFGNIIAGNMTVNEGRGYGTGGGAYIEGKPSPRIVHNTFYGNCAGHTGGAIFCMESDPVIINTILWHDSAPWGSEISSESSDVKPIHCAVEGGWPGPGNTDADPLFLDAGKGDFRLRPFSPCIDGGRNGINGMPSVDLDGDPRLVKGGRREPARVDIGCDEYVPSPDVDDPEGPERDRKIPRAPNPGPTTAILVTPPERIQEAVDGALEGQTVLVAPGTYRENIDFKGKAITLRSEKGPGATVIDGQGTGPVVTFRSGERAGTILDGFTLRNGEAPCGGGILCRNGSSPRIINNVITANTALMGGGGIWIHRSVPTVSNNRIVFNTSKGRGGGIACCESSCCEIIENRIEENSASTEGGGIAISAASPSVRKNTVGNNTAGFSGGGISCNSPTSRPIECSPLIESNLIIGNRAVSHDGGGVRAGSASPLIINNKVLENVSGRQGGGIFCSWRTSAAAFGNLVRGNRAKRGGGMAVVYTKGESSLPSFAHNTVVDNEAAEWGGGFYCIDSAPEILNSIFWGNAAPEGGEIYNKEGNAVIAFCDVKGGWSGTGNIDADPLFTDPARGEFHLLPSSPCIDAGTSDLPDPPPSDMDGDPRILKGRKGPQEAAPDMGADEFREG